MPGKHITHRSSCNGEEGGSREAIEESCNEHGGDVGSHRTGNDPNNEHQIGPHIDGATAVELEPMVRN